MIGERSLLLDTCSLLWLADKRSALSRNALSAFRENPGNLYVSAISGFELDLKHKTQRLILPLPPGEWYEKSKQLHGIQEIAVDGTISIRAALLPLIHSDPCDRFIIATALTYNIPIVTPDRIFPEYPDIRIVW